MEVHRWFVGFGGTGAAVGEDGVRVEVFAVGRRTLRLEDGWLCCLRGFLLRLGHLGGVL